MNPLESASPSDPLPAYSRDAVRRTSSDGRRLSLPLLISLFFHALMLSLQFGSQEFGLPGFALPWQDRRVEVPELRAVLTLPPLMEAKPASSADPVPLLPEPQEQSLAAGPMIVTFKAPAPPPVQAAPAQPRPRSTPSLPKAKPKPKAATVAAPTKVLTESPADPARRGSG
ncbi:MAG: hypothetical protein IPJ38_03480 [Dechloromonas sp.]|uniref:Uncharacterized protein n=1 Tax=Candidatus Dechloromonas phosphorivorans TaxID=2899244 RepID=A0A935JXF3_9RHOO|nr:hypothetical protein [Candidatus Dechloromonas phosphorivorans]